MSSNVKPALDIALHTLRTSLVCFAWLPFRSLWLRVYVGRLCGSHDKPHAPLQGCGHCGRTGAADGFTGIIDGVAVWRTGVWVLTRVIHRVGCPEWHRKSRVFHSTVHFRERPSRVSKLIMDLTVVLTARPGAILLYAYRLPRPRGRTLDLE